MCLRAPDQLRILLRAFCFGLYRPFTKYLQDWVRRCQTPPYRRRDIHVIYSTIYSAIYSHRAHDVDESPEDHQGHIKRLYCTLFPALHPLRTLIYSSPPPKENKGVTRPLLTAALPGCADVTAGDSSYSSSTQKRPCSWRSRTVWYVGTGPLDRFQSQLARRCASFRRWHL